MLHVYNFGPATVFARLCRIRHVVAYSLDHNCRGGGLLARGGRHIFETVKSEGYDKWWGGGKCRESRILAKNGMNLKELGDF